MLPHPEHPSTEHPDTGQPGLECQALPGWEHSPHHPPRGEPDPARNQTCLVLCPRCTRQGEAGLAHARLSTGEPPAPGAARAASPCGARTCPGHSRCWGRGARPWGQRNCLGGSPSGHSSKPHSSPQAGKSLFTELPMHPKLQGHLTESSLEKPACFEPVSQICADLKN